MRHSIVAFMFMASTIALAGCSVSIPLPALFGAEDDVTGSISKFSGGRRSGQKPLQRAALPGTSGIDGPVPEEFDQRDWIYARPYLMQALAPQNSGTSFDWTNAVTGGSGSFTALSGEFPQGTRSCRAFIADTGAAAAQKTLEGLACQVPGGDWDIAFPAAAAQGLQ